MRASSIGVRHALTEPSRRTGVRVTSLDTDLLHLLGLDGLPPGEAEAILDLMESVLEDRLSRALLARSTQAERSAMIVAAASRGQDPGPSPDLRAWIEQNRPDFVLEAWVQLELLCAEIRAVVEESGSDPSLDSLDGAA